MNTPPPLVWLGDFIRAAGVLEAQDAATLHAIARLLGVEEEEASAEEEYRRISDDDVWDEVKEDVRVGADDTHLPTATIPSTLRVVRSASGTPKPRVFISYSFGDDDADTNRSLLDELTRALDPDFEVLVDRSLTVGYGAWTAITGWIEESDAGLLLLSGAALRSTGVSRELDMFLSRAKRDPEFRIVPVLVPPVRPADLEDTPELRALRSHQLVGGDDIDAIIRNVRAALGSLRRRMPPGVQRALTAVPLPAGGSEENPEPLPLDPLLAPGWARAILGTALATPTGEGEVDVDRVAEQMGRLQPVTRVPRLPLASLRHGAQVLVDHGRGMQPFHRDLAWLRDALERVVGRGRCEVLRFAGTPLRGAGSGPRIAWGEYRPPAPGTPVLVLTDVGIGKPALSADPAGPAEWLAFAALLRRAGCPLLALVPYAPSRWPRELAGGMTLLPWDRGTSAAQVRGAVTRAPGRA